MKNKMLICFVFLLLTVCWGCDNSSLVLDGEYSSLNLSVKNSVYEVGVDSVGLIVYFSEPHVYHDGKEYFLYVYNNPLHSIDIYNLSRKTFKNRIKLGESGVDEIRKFYNMYVKSPDSVYVMGAGRFYLINQSGNVLKRFSAQYDASDITNGGYFYSPNEATFNIDMSGSRFRGYFVHNDVVANNRSTESLKNFFLGQMDLTSGALSLLPLNYSEFIQTNYGDFSNEISPNLEFSGDEIFYNWPIESNIYRYDLVENKTETFGAKSKYSVNEALPYSKNPNYDFRTEGTWFNRVHRYPGTDYFYRTHWGSQPKTTLSGESSGATTKPGFIMFFDKDMKIIDEVEIDNSCHLELSFSTDEGVFFWAKDGADESTMKLCQYTIEGVN